MRSLGSQGGRTNLSEKSIAMSRALACSMRPRSVFSLKSTEGSVAHKIKNSESVP